MSLSVFTNNFQFTVLTRYKMMHVLEVKYILKDNVLVTKWYEECSKHTQPNLKRVILQL